MYIPHSRCNCGDVECAAVQDRNCVILPGGWHDIPHHYRYFRRSIYQAVFSPENLMKTALCVKMEEV
jgi:hypothetical protein